MKHLTIYRQFLTENDCYKKSTPEELRGVQVHSTGANNPWLKRYVQPDDGRLGVNRNGNSHNRPGGDVCASAYIGRLEDGTVAVYQTLPWNVRCWLSGSGQNGNANRMGYKGFEICQDSLTDEAYFRDAVMDKAVTLTAYLCQLGGFSPYKQNAVFGNRVALAVADHHELHAAGLASNHADITHWLRNFGLTMNDFRKAVQDILDQGGVEVDYVDGPADPVQDQPVPAAEEGVKAVVDNPRRWLNVHKSQDTREDTVLFQIEKGTHVEILAEDGDWLQIRSGSRIGWVVAQYIRVLDPQPEAPPPADPPEEPADQLEEPSDQTEEPSGVLHLDVEEELSATWQDLKKLTFRVQRLVEYMFPEVDP